MSNTVLMVKHGHFISLNCSQEAILMPTVTGRFHCDLCLQRYNILTISLSISLLRTDVAKQLDDDFPHIRVSTDLANTVATSCDLQ